jgi:hypothetical protein
MAGMWNSANSLAELRTGWSKGCFASIFGGQGPTFRCWSLGLRFGTRQRVGDAFRTAEYLGERMQTGSEVDGRRLERPFQEVSPLVFVY